MTNEELLQQAKDEYAQKSIGQYPDWATMEEWFTQVNSKEDAIQLLLSMFGKAAEKAIQSAREEAIDIIEEALACTPQDVDSVLKNGLKKLTAPGR